MEPETGYARLGDDIIAYQIIGDGPIDIVDSTRRAEELGDRRWREVLDYHDDRARGLVEENAGRLIKTTGDGILATFDGPGRAIRGATLLQDEL